MSRTSGYSRVVWESLIGFWRVWVIHLGRRYGLISALSKARGPLGGDELARSLNLNPQAVNAWLESAYTLKIVGKTSGGYTLPKPLITLLVDDGDPKFMGGLVSYYALRSLDFDAFDALFSGGMRSETHSPHLGEAFVEGTRWDHTVFLKIVLPKIPTLRRTLKAGCRVLDLGCGSGGWIAKVAPNFHNSYFLGVDPDEHSIQEAREKCRLIPNAEFMIGRAEHLGFKEEFDLIYLGEVLYIIGDRQGVINACYDALKPKGYVVVCEAVCDPGRNTWKDENTLVRGALLDYMAQEGRTLGRREISRLLTNAGFTQPREHNMHGGLWFFVSRKTRSKNVWASAHHP